MPNRGEGQPPKDDDSATQEFDFNEESASTESATEEELRKAVAESLKSSDIAQAVREALHSQEVAAVYIHHTTIGGPVSGPLHTGSGHVYGQTTIGTGARSDNVIIGRVSRQDLEKIRSVYVVSDSYQLAWDKLQDDHLLFIQGKAHWGKWTTAVHLLAPSSNVTVFQVNPAISADGLLQHVWQTEQRYVIDTIASDRVQRLSKAGLDQLSGKLKERKSYLVVTVDSTVTLRAAVVDNYLLDWKELPKGAELLRKHLQWYCDDELLLKEAAALAGETFMQELLDEHLLPRDVDQLSQLTVRAARGELSSDQIVSRYGGHVHKQVTEWFKKHQDFENRTLLLTAAVLNGATESIVFESSKRFQEMLVEPSATESRDKVEASYFGPTIEQRLAVIGARPVDSYEQTEFGLNPVRKVVLDNPLFQPTVLGYVWRNYPRLRETLTAWLFDLGLHSNSDVRIRAAAAAGELTKYDLGYIRTTLLLPWAKHKNANARRVAAFALGIPAWEGTLAPQIINLLHHWSRSGNNWRLCWTAAAAYGGLVGVKFPEAALSDLRAIAALGDVRLLDVIASSMSSLFEMGRKTSDHYEKVLFALREWSEEGDSDATSLTGLYVFLDLGMRSTMEAEPPDGDWPTLLWLAGEESSYREVVLTLWRRALNSKPTRGLAADTLRLWLLSADDAPSLFGRVEELVRTIVKEGSDREAKRLIFYLKRWSSSVKSAARLVGTLNGS